MLTAEHLYVLHERAVLLDLLEGVRRDHPLVSPYVLEHLFAAAVRAYLDGED